MEYFYILCVLYKIAIDNLWTVHCNDIWYLRLAKFLSLFLFCHIFCLEKCFPVIYSHSAT